MCYTDADIKSIICHAKNLFYLLCALLKISLNSGGLILKKDVVLVVDGISSKTKEFSRRYIVTDAEVVFADGDPGIIDQYLETAKVLVTSTKGIPPEMLSKAKNCVYIQKYGAGVNNIDIGQATDRNIPVGNVPATNSRSVAEYTLTLLLAVYKQIIKAHNELTQNGKWLKTVLRDNNHELTGKTVGLIGLGNIGKHLRRLLVGFDCRVIYFDAFRLPSDQERELGVEFMEIDDLLALSDVVSLHCPLTEETHHLIDDHRISRMKPGAVLLNCARGGVVDEKALYEALKTGKLSGAGIDTFENEPADNTHPFCSLPNVVLSPHNGGGTVEAVEAVVKGASENINSMLQSGTIAQKKYIVNLTNIKL